MNLALNCWFYQSYNTRILTGKLSPYYFTYLLFNARFRKEQKLNLLQMIRLFISEMRDAIGFRQQLNTTSFEAFELEITVNYPVHTWTENDSFMRNLTSWSVPFWLVLLTEHKVIDCYALNAVCRCLVAGQLYPSWGFSSADCLCFQVSDFCRAIHSTAFVYLLLWQREIFNRNRKFLQNFHDFILF